MRRCLDTKQFYVLLLVVIFIMNSISQKITSNKPSLEKYNSVPAAAASPHHP